MAHKHYKCTQFFFNQTRPPFVFVFVFVCLHGVVLASTSVTCQQRPAKHCLSARPASLAVTITLSLSSDALRIASPTCRASTFPNLSPTNTFTVISTPVLLTSSDSAYSELMYSAPITLKSVLQCRLCSARYASRASAHHCVFLTPPLFNVFKTFVKSVPMEATTS
jgi:hypothetical protein